MAECSHPQHIEQTPDNQSSLTLFLTSYDSFLSYGTSQPDSSCFQHTGQSRLPRFVGDLRVVIED
jgi:hypothetical protein